MAIANLPSTVFDIFTAAAVDEDPMTSRNILIIISQAAYIPELVQHFSLLHAIQTRHHKGIDKYSTIYVSRWRHPIAQYGHLCSLSISLQ